MPPAPGIATSGTQHALSFDALPNGAPRPLAQGDSRANVRKDSTRAINLKPDQLALLNAHTPRQERFGDQRGLKNVTTDSPYEHANIGTIITSNYAGVYAMQSGYQGFKVADGTAVLGQDPRGFPYYNVVFADTTKEPNGCFESGSGFWSGTSAFYVFDFCRGGGQFIVVKLFQTSEWFAYARNYADGTQSYTIENYRSSDGADHAMLYNNQNNVWEEIATEPPGAAVSDTSGWSFTEYYNEPNQRTTTGGGAPGYCQAIGFSGQTDYAYRPVTATAYALDYGSYTLETVGWWNSYFINSNGHGPASCLSTSQDGSFPSYYFSYAGNGSSPYTVASTWTVSAQNPTPTPAPTWHVLNGAASSIGAGPGFDPVVIGSNPLGPPGNFALYQWVGSPAAGSFSAQLAGYAWKVAVAPEGTVWALTADHQISRAHGSGYDVLPGSAREISVTSAGTAYVVGDDPVGPAGNYGIHRWNGTTWTQVEGYASKVSVSSDGVLWAITADYQISRANPSGGYVVLPGAAYAIAAAPRGIAYVIGTSPTGPGGYQIYQYTGTTWVPVPGGYGVAVAVSPDGSTVYSLGSDLSIRAYY
ncbi:MAG: hypothetical protein M3169_04415 [Candidatus Eremiobacteraeota bacterium]|nr:hypothetical protein [Candidatus Eremiobacteraeota bacterium]